jgi:hypothetical protein
MGLADAIAAFVGLFILAMTWLRTRLHYPRTAFGRTHLTRAGMLYFGALLVLFLIGWFAAPALARRLSSAAFVTPVLARVAWFLGGYYLFIALHRTLKARRVPVFAG